MRIRTFLYLVLSLCFLSSSAFGDHFRIPPKNFSSPCKIKYPTDQKFIWKCRTLKKGETLETLFGERWEDVARFNRIDRRHAFPGISLKVPTNLSDIKGFSPLPEKYPLYETEERFILIDLSEQFLGAYKHGTRVFSFPISTGKKIKGLETPIGEFRITAFDRNHSSSLYQIEEINIPYPMNYALRFFISRVGTSYWIHGRDIPGYPASHGCIGLYDEAMQRQTYGSPKDPNLADAKRLFEWALGNASDSGKEVSITNGPKVLIVGKTP